MIAMGYCRAKMHSVCASSTAKYVCVCEKESDIERKGERN